MEMEFANRLYDLRKAHGYSQDELADLLNVSRQAVSKWERGESYPDTDNLISLAKLYKISVDDLLGYKPEQIADQNACEQEDQNVCDGQKDEDCDCCNCCGDCCGDGTNNGGCRIDVDFDDIDEAVDDAIDEDEDIDEAFSQDIKRNVKESIRRFFNNLNDEISKEMDKNGDCGKYAKDGHICGCEEDKISASRKTLHSCIDGSVALLSVVGYLLLGFLANAWHPGWIIFFAIPVSSCFVGMIIKKNPCDFPLALLVVVAYLLMGFLADLWHPGWVIFFAIPVYYLIADAIHKYSKRRKASK